MADGVPTTGHADHDPQRRCGSWLSIILYRDWLAQSFAIKH
jgi:hypothetical protein